MAKLGSKEKTFRSKPVNNGKMKKKGTKCKICQKNDHRTKNCPRTLCEHCGQMKGHHTNIGINGPCSNILLAKKVEESEFNEDYHCKKCYQIGHISMKCPSIWRAYIKKRALSKNFSKNVLPIHTIFCYYCGMRGHYGDDCPTNGKPKSMKYQRSAFSGKNLSKNLKAIYYNQLHNTNQNDESNLPTKYKRGGAGHFFPPPYKILRAPESLEEI